MILQILINIYFLNKFLCSDVIQIGAVYIYDFGINIAKNIGYQCNLFGFHLNFKAIKLMS